MGRIAHGLRRMSLQTCCALRVRFASYTYDGGQCSPPAQWVLVRDFRMATKMQEWHEPFLHVGTIIPHRHSGEATGCSKALWPSIVAVARTASAVLSVSSAMSARARAHDVQNLSQIAQPLRHMSVERQSYHHLCRVRTFVQPESACRLEWMDR